WIAALTPVILALVVSLIFLQPLVLIMGLLGPAMVFGSWYESRRQGSQTRQRDLERYSAAQAEYTQEISDIRSREKKRALTLLPSLMEAAAQPLWRRSALLEHGCRIGLGWAQFPDGHPLRGTPGMSGMPSVVDPSHTITLVGEETWVGLWRTIAVSWVLAGAGSLRLDSHGELPRTVRGISDAHWVATPEEVPEDCSVVILCGNNPTVEVRSSGVSAYFTVPDQLSSAQAHWILRHFSALEEIPRDDDPRDESPRHQLWCSLSPDSPEWDLIREGPHAVVWGATGSGKSVTVTAIVQSLAARYRPEDLVCVLIDFKGGAGLRALQDLPHTIGSITDMDGAGASRALVGLHSELLRRERILHAQGATDISEVVDGVSLPRLVVVIDEAAWLLTNFPEFPSALSDVLARGRSLGVHVIISTQRVTGVLSHAMMANISLRICGRVIDDSDALSWIPDLTMSLRERVRHLKAGEVILAGASLKPTLHTVTRATRLISHENQSSWRVWADPLPEDVSVTGETWGLVDDVPAGTHRNLNREDAPSASCLVVGDSGRGKTTALRTLSSMRSLVTQAPRHPFLLWFWWTHARREGAIVLDDLDRTLTMAGDEGAQVLLELLHSSPSPLLMSMTPDSRHQRVVARLAEEIIVLGVAKNEVRAALGGVASSLPGRARYREETIQVARGAAALAETQSPCLVPDNAACVVTRSPESWAEAPLALVLSPEELARRWHEVAERGQIIIDSISPSDMRGATMGRICPPALPIPELVLLVWCRGRFELSARAWWKE
ncbi:MAG: hypothetical protein K9G03_04000, partial [Pontimonas sp.]|nr:hypothetical protein [Pontimonas sp.]